MDKVTGNGPQPVSTGDAHAVLLPWAAEIDAMFKQTTDGETGPFRLMLSSVSVVHDASDGGSAGFRHGVAFHVEQEVDGSWEPMLNNEDKVSLYHYQAIDYGNLCPPRCRKFSRPRQEKGSSLPVAS
jgi:hypothetical protein